MFSKYSMLFITVIILVLRCASAGKYQFIPARCEDHPGAEAQIGGPLSICSFPPKYEAPNAEDIQAVIKHIQGLDLN